MQVICPPIMLYLDNRATAAALSTKNPSDPYQTAKPKNRTALS